MLYPFLWAILLGLLSTVLFIRRRKKYEWLTQFPGPTPVLPFLGNGLQFLGHPSRFDDVFHENFRKFGKTWRLWLLDKPTLVTSDPQLIQTILGSHAHLDKHFMYDQSFQPVLGEYGLFTTKETQWKSDRKIFNKLFNWKLLEHGFSVCLLEWENTKGTILSHNAQPVDTLALFKRAYISISISSLNLDFTREEMDIIHEHFERGLDLITARLNKPWTRNTVWGKLSGFETQMENLHKIASTLIQGKIEILSRKSNEDKNHNTEPIKTISTVKDLLTDAEIPYKWKHDQCITFIGASVDTSSITTTMTLFFLAVHPELQKKAQEEVDLLFELKDNAPLQAHDLSGLKYLRMCMKESMRLHTSVPLIGRTTSEVIILDDGRKIPAHSSILLSLRELHRNPDYHNCPEQFDPERFSDENVSSFKPCTYIPFSIGPRNCIGYKFAETVILTTLSLTLRHFSVKTFQKPENMKILYEIGGTPYPKVKLVFEQRRH